MNKIKSKLEYSCAIYMTNQGLISSLSKKKENFTNISTSAPKVKCAKIMTPNNHKRKTIDGMYTYICSYILYVHVSFKLANRLCLPGGDPGAAPERPKASLFASL